ncbi:MAG: heavy metal-binding domain-containing protein [Rhizobiales bacterium]|nr:heavy metal-binding domain-containing protein [Hyphomicrobiales bacterium]
MSEHAIRLTSLESLAEDIVPGSLLHASAVSAANIIKDLREHITNTFGGRMSRYEAMLDETIERALEELRQRAIEAGYDGVLGVRIVHPNIVDGGVEVVVYGTGYRLRARD